MTTLEQLESVLATRIAVTDGAMGTMIQSYGLSEADFRGDDFTDHPRDLQGCNDLLSITRPDVISAIHESFLDAGADIIETNTFTATSIALADYAMEEQAYAINVAAARIARAAVDAAMAADPSRTRFVAGSMGPTNKTASLSPDVNDPGFRAVTFDELAAAYYEQARGLVDGGVDFLLPETAFDTLNVKAALSAIDKLFADGARRVPVWCSMTIVDKSGRTLSGQTTEAFYNSIAHADLAVVGINCALGPAEMRAYVEELARIVPTYVACVPNAGLPNELGGYDETPEHMAALLGDFASSGLVNIVGGCCGTRPEHIRAIAAAVAGAAPRQLAQPAPATRLSGLEALTITPESNFIVIGERTNVAGSLKFKRLIADNQLEEALTVARQQVEGGANILDVCMDDAMLDGEAAMTRFLHMVASDPDISRLPIMIDSSKFSVIEAGLRCLQGKGVVNSISLKEGEAEFERQARIVRSFGAAVVVMGFDENGQATTVDHRIAIAKRAYAILTERVGFPAEDIIFDPNVLTVGTGIAEHDDYAVAFLEATRQLKQLFPGCKVSGGISNVSFSFRGNNPVREAMHAAFLYHAIRAGLDMGIVNAGQLAIYEEIPTELRTLVEDVLLNRDADATERLVTAATAFKDSAGNAVAATQEWREAPLPERIAHALLKGTHEFVDSDIAEALTLYDEPLNIIEGPLMDGMERVGDLFGAGKMFLPQVVKSARVMKKAVAILEPLMDAGGTAKSKGVIVMATVKGDVHDIGKNITGVVLRCNGYSVIDLGVMVPTAKILATAREVGADIIGLSGLITPSLDEMVHVAREMKRLGFTIPLLIGGATTSNKHTSVKIAPEYDHITAHVRDASRAPGVVGQLLNPDKRAGFAAKNAAKQELLRTRYAAGQVARDLVSIEQARQRRTPIEWRSEDLPAPAFLGLRAIEVDITELVDFIDWTPFFHTWDLKGRFPDILDSPKVGERARELHADARALLDRIAKDKLLGARGVYGFLPAAARGDDIIIYADEQRDRERARLFMLRQQGQKTPCYSLADFVAPVSSGLADHIGVFAVTAGLNERELSDSFAADNDDYNAIMTKALADRLAEAFAEMLHGRVRAEWGGRAEEVGIRPAFGYPACPDHTEKQTLFELVDAGRAGIELTETMMMTPAASVSGIYLNHPESRYFSIGKIGRDQVEDYARRKGISRAQAERRLGVHLGY